DVNEGDDNHDPIRKMGVRADWAGQRHRTGGPHHQHGGAAVNLAAVAKLFDILPGWVWAAIVAGALLHGCAVGMQRDGARLEAATVKATAAAEHAEHLDAMVTQTNLVLKKTNELRELRAAQDRKDSDAKSTI